MSACVSVNVQTFFPNKEKSKKKVFILNQISQILFKRDLLIVAVADDLFTSQECDASGS